MPRYSDHTWVTNTSSAIVSSVAYYVQRQLTKEAHEFDGFFAQKHDLAEQLLQEDNKKILHEVNEGQKNLLNILGK